MREEIIAKIEKWQEPPPAKTVKPLPRPDEHEVGHSLTEQFTFGYVHEHVEKDRRWS